MLYGSSEYAKVEPKPVVDGGNDSSGSSSPPSSSLPGSAIAAIVIVPVISIVLIGAVFQGAVGGLNIDDVKNIRDALVKVYLPIIMADPELKVQYEAKTIRELQRVGARIDRQNERAIQAILEERLDSQ